VNNRAAWYPTPLPLVSGIMGLAGIFRFVFESKGLISKSSGIRTYGFAAVPGFEWVNRVKGKEPSPFTHRVEYLLSKSADGFGAAWLNRR